jgi:pyruvate/2-oxoglutarate dehydrogenase complex dihydrolipoamide dehydrogenase (E3) component
MSYIKNKKKFGEDIGVHVEICEFPSDILQSNLEEDDELILEEVKNRFKAARKINVLNKTKLTKAEMDEIFNGEQ